MTARLIMPSLRDHAVLAAAARYRRHAGFLYAERVAVVSRAMARATGRPSYTAEQIVEEGHRLAHLSHPQKRGEPLAVVEARLNFLYFTETFAAAPAPTLDERTAFELLRDAIA